MNTKQKGDIAEAQVIAAMLKDGFSVLIPFGDRNRYDFVLEENGEYLRIQVKTGSRCGKSLRFKSCSTTTEAGRVKHVHYKGQADVFAVYDPISGKIYLVPVENCGERDTRLSLNGKPRNQHKPLLAVDFEFSAR